MSVTVYALPLALLIQGVLKPSKGVALTFFLGALTIATTIIRFTTLKVGTGQPNLVCKFARACTELQKQRTVLTATLSIDPLSIVEMTLAIIVVALPGLQPLFGRSASRQSSVETVEVEHGAKTYSS